MSTLSPGLSLLASLVWHERPWGHEQVQVCSLSDDVFFAGTSRGGAVGPHDRRERATFIDDRRVAGWLDPQIDHFF